MKKLIVALSVLVVLGGCGDTGSGEKIGIVTKAAQQGVFCRTNEIEIIRGGMNNGTGAVGQAFHFTVEDNAVFDQLVKAMEEQREVRIKYRREWATFCRTDSAENAFLTSVDIATPVGITRPAPVAVTTPVEVKAAPAVPTNETQQQKVTRLLAVQAELIKELAGK